jgi:Rad3-related DNA helicase
MSHPRLIWHDRHDTRDKYREFRDRTDNCVLVACGLHEGIDIADDFGRWQVITKVPYPSLADAAVSVRAQLDPEGYQWATIKTILQASGRICRHPTDFGVTIITDNAFETLYQRNRHLFPQWFSQALIIR